MSSVDKIFRNIREFGIGAGLIYLVARTLHVTGSRFQVFLYELMAQPIPDRPMLPASLGRSIEVRELPRGDPAYDAMPLTSDVLEWRFRQPSVCLAAFQGGRMVAYMWLCFEAYDEDEVRCRFLMSPVDQSVWDFDFYVFPEHRTGLAFVALWDGANRYLRERGVKTSFSRVSRYNTASRTSHMHLKWVRIGRALFLRATRFQLMLATRRPFLHVTLSGGTSPQLTVEAPPRPANV